MGTEVSESESHRRRVSPHLCAAAVKHVSPEIPAEEVALEFGSLIVRVWRAAELERFVDGEALLRDEAAPEPPYWMHLWPGALAAARWIAGAAEVRPGARVLELGCGLGLPALVAARRGAAVVASDCQGAPLAFVQRSAAANGCAVAVVQMDWSAPALRAQFDLCVGADVGYDAAAEADLVTALDHMVAPGGVVCLADSVNTARDSLAARLTAVGFTVGVGSVPEAEDGRPVWVRIISARRRA
jgi:predicted nicotinamide N-methyase